MMRRIAFVLVPFLVGLAAAALAFGLMPSARRTIAENPAGPREATLQVADSGWLKLTAEQIDTSGIKLAKAKNATLSRRISVPGTIIPDADRIARVSVRLSGTVAELRKKIGDGVGRGEILAILESREVADAKSEYLAARLTNDLQQDLYQRDTVLRENKFLTDQQFLRSKASAAEAKIRLNIARQKLVALGLDSAQINDLPSQPEEQLRLQPVLSPMAGRVVERRVDLGTAVGRDNLETEVFVVADLSTVWVDLAVSPVDLPTIKEGGAVEISSRAVSRKAVGKVIFISPLLDKETRAARVVAEIDNRDGAWRPGSFVTATIATDERAVDLAVPVAALQTIGGQKVVFVRIDDGFQKRAVAIGRSDEQDAEITGGLRPGETIAVSNTFLLKSELLKGSVED